MPLGLNLVDNLMEYKNLVEDCPLIKANRLGCLSLLANETSLIAHTFAKIQWIALITTIDLMCLIPVATPHHLGIRVITPKFRRDISSVPVYNSWNIGMITTLIWS